MSDEEARLEKRLKELREAKAGVSKLRTLESFTVEEKCKKFDELFEFAKRIMDEKAKTGYDPKDASHYAFEEVMNILGPDVWKVYNKL